MASVSVHPKLTKTQSEINKSFQRATASSPTDVCFSFDTSPSMYHSIAIVRKTVEDTATKLLHSLPQLRIALIAQGDYESDTNGGYCTRSMDFSRNVAEIVDFVKNVPGTRNSTNPECYEKVLYEANRLSWNPLATKALVIFGDDLPHPPSFTSERFSWRQEITNLQSHHCRIYAVRCGTHAYAKIFYEEMAELTGGVFVELEDFEVIDKMFMAICYREVSPDKLILFESEIDTEAKKRGEETDPRLRRMFRRLSDENLTQKNTTDRFVSEAWWNDENDASKNSDVSPRFVWNDERQLFEKASPQGGKPQVLSAKGKRGKGKKRKASSTILKTASIKPAYANSSKPTAAKAVKDSASIASKLQKKKQILKKQKKKQKTENMKAPSSNEIEVTHKVSTKKRRRSKKDWEHPYSTPPLPEWYFR